MSRSNIGPAQASLFRLEELRNAADQEAFNQALDEVNARFGGPEGFLRQLRLEGVGGSGVGTGLGPDFSVPAPGLADQSSIPEPQIQERTVFEGPIESKQRTRTAAELPLPKLGEFQSQGPVAPASTPTPQEPSIDLTPQQQPPQQRQPQVQAPNIGQVDKPSTEVQGVQLPAVPVGQSQGQSQSQDQGQSQILGQSQELRADGSLSEQVDKILPEDLGLQLGLQGAGQQVLQADIQNPSEAILAAGTGALAGTTAADQVRRQARKQLRQDQIDRLEQIVDLRKAQQDNIPKIVRLQNARDRALARGEQDRAKEIAAQIKKLGQGDQSNALLEGGTVKDETSKDIKQALLNRAPAGSFDVKTGKISGISKEGKQAALELASKVEQIIKERNSPGGEDPVAGVSSAINLALEQNPELAQTLERQSKPQATVNLPPEAQRKNLNDAARLEQFLALGVKNLDEVVEGTGPAGVVRQMLQGSLGALTNAEISFPDKERARQKLRFIRNQALSLLRSSGGRLSNFEQQRLEELLPNPDAFFRDPKAELRKFATLLQSVNTRRKLASDLVQGQVPEFVPRPETEEEFKELEPGTFFIDPKSGNLKQKALSDGGD